MAGPGRRAGDKEQVMVVLTKNAGEAAKRMIYREKLLGYGLRAAIVGGGLNGFEYTLAFCEGPSPADLVFESEGLFIYVDPASHAYLDGVTIDYVAGEEGRGFVFLNPRSLSLLSGSLPN